MKILNKLNFYVGMQTMVRSFAHRIPWIFIAFIICPTHISFLFRRLFFTTFFCCCWSFFLLLMLMLGEKISFDSRFYLLACSFKFRWENAIVWVDIFYEDFWHHTLMLSTLIQMRFLCSFLRHRWIVAHWIA